MFVSHAPEGKCCSLIHSISYKHILSLFIINAITSDNISLYHHSYHIIF